MLLKKDNFPNMRLSDIMKLYRTEKTHESDFSVSVVIPVYNGYDLLKRNLDSVQENTPPDVRIIVINDASTDIRIREYLKDYRKRENWTVLENKSNLGFVKSVNKAMKAVDTDIAILLNSDTEVPKLWIERITAPFKDRDDLATATPFSNSATIFSYPEFNHDNELKYSLESINSAIMKISPYESSLNDVYSGCGFCMAVNMKAWKESGEFDDAAFERGYGEENDWCMRASGYGYKHVLVQNLFVKHVHGASFGSELRKGLIAEHHRILNQRYPEIMTRTVPEFNSADKWAGYRFLLSLLLSAGSMALIISARAFENGIPGEIIGKAEAKGLSAVTVTGAGDGESFIIRAATADAYNCCYIQKPEELEAIFKNFKVRAVWVLEDGGKQDARTLGFVNYIKISGYKGIIRKVKTGRHPGLMKDTISCVTGSGFDGDYGRQYYEKHCGEVSYAEKTVWKKRYDMIADCILRDFNPDTVLDAGCAFGYLVEALRERGVKAYGIDISEYAVANAPEEIRPYCFRGSITDVFPDALPRHFDLVTNIEVLEHIRPSDAGSAVRNLCSLTDTILFSSTPDDYDEPSHVNVQKRDYWAGLFYDNGFYDDVSCKPDYISPHAVCFKRGQIAREQITGYEKLIQKYETVPFTKNRNSRFRTKIYFDTGKGFTEEASVWFILEPGTVFNKKIDIPDRCRRIRWEPLIGNPCLAWDIRANTDTAELKVKKHNGTMTGPVFASVVQDPLILFEDLPEEASYVEISAKIIPMNYDGWKCFYAETENRVIAAQEKTAEKSSELEAVYNSTCWKVTKPLRAVKDAIKRLKGSVEDLCEKR